jgi:acyl carrier protein
MERPISHLAILSASEMQQLKTQGVIGTGKTERRPLQHAPEENLYEAPRTPLEHMIADAWQEALGLEKVGLDDNFFDLGGHSMLVVSVRFNLREKLQQEIALVDFFFYPTVRLLAEKLEQRNRV